jgi:hypothetical protein
VAWEVVMRANLVRVARFSACVALLTPVPWGIAAAQPLFSGPT